MPVRRGAYARPELIGRSSNADNRYDRMLSIAAAVAVVGRGAVASHSDAAVVHRLHLLDPPPPDVISVCRSSGREGMRRGSPAVRVRRAPLPSTQVVVRDGVPVTSAARTVADLARTTSFQSGIVVADSALHSGKTSKAELAGVLQSCDRWPGVGQARRVLEFSDGLSESPFESIARVVFHEGGLPAPELQAWVGADGFIVGRADFFWRQHATIAEADGALKYANPQQARMQLERDARLRTAGFEVVHFTWGQLIGNPELVVASIEAAFRRSAALRRGERRAG